MALRLVRRIVPAAASAVRAACEAQQMKVHTSAVRNLEYGYLAYMLGERTTPRFTQTSKIISVDGNLSSGKGALAQKLAESLGMLYMPEPDIHYLNPMSGETDPLPSYCSGLCSLERFYMDPKAADGNSYRLQLWMYNMRLLYYSDAVQHLLSTGQGVVLERSPFSDMVFLDAMFKEGYIRKQCVDHYNEIKHISICEFLPPHVSIYIDVPAEEVQTRLKQSSKSYLHNIPLSYLKNIENCYKKTFLPQISETSELLVYDSVQSLDFEKVAEDFEYLKFDKGPWLEKDDVDYHHMRMFVEDKARVGDLTHIPKYLPEITIGAHDYDKMYYAYKSLPGRRFAEGFNADVGDKNIWLK